MKIYKSIQLFTSVYGLCILRPGLNASRFVSNLTVNDVEPRLYTFQMQSRAQVHYTFSMLIPFLNVASHVQFITKYFLSHQSSCI